jgi:NAD(P)-dependent dehydrogenase (short-subunit alcohol dehydrogenase family)
LFTVQKGLPLLRDHASIIMTGSLSALKASPNTSVYSASKAALDALARCWTADLKERKIRVNVIHPGSIDTPLFQKSTDDQKATYLSHIPLGRFGRPEEIATTALFLATADAGFITGASIIVDGGAHI